MTDAQATDLQTLAAQVSRQPVPEPVSAIADAVRSNAPDLTGTPGGIIAMLAYGSCLRDASVEESLVDLYILVDRYASFHSGRPMQLLNRLVPPNVYYAECRHDGRQVRAKYAVVSLDQFEQRVKPDIRNPYFWARFAQPTAIVYARDEQTRSRVEAALATAIMTTLGHGLALAGETASPRDAWTAVFQRTYGTELRSEDAGRAGQIVDANLDFYRTAFTLRQSRFWRFPGFTIALEMAACRRQAPVRGPARQGRIHLSGRCRLSGLEDRATFRRHGGAHALATPAPHSRSLRSLATSLYAGRFPVGARPNPPLRRFQQARVFPWQPPTRISR